jgi:hypothetical protein
MKLFLLTVCGLFFGAGLAAQLIITPEATLSMSGNVRMTLVNTNLINNGSFTAGHSFISFSGDLTTGIGGTQPLNFHELEVNKAGNTRIVLVRAVGISGRLLFTKGFLDLNSYNADLGSTGFLHNETENARIIGADGGEVIFNANLNAPMAVNPANLGILITSPQDLGHLTIRRGHKTQLNNAGGNSILRYYEVVPSDNANPNATLVISYMDAELNNLPENNLQVFESGDAVNWTQLGFTSKDVNSNFLVKTGIARFGRFTLFNSNTILPVRFVSLNTRCEASAVILTWKTAGEQNMRHFTVERSADGLTWTDIGQLPASGNGTGETTYTFIDHGSRQNSHYRIAANDPDGRRYLSGSVRSSCAAKDVFTVFPNPVTDKLFINIVAANGSDAFIRLFDSKGALLKQQSETIGRGNNRFGIDVRFLPGGVYHLSVSWNSGQANESFRLMKK